MDKIIDFLLSDDGRALIVACIAWIVRAIEKPRVIKKAKKGGKNE